MSFEALDNDDVDENGEEPHIWLWLYKPGTWLISLPFSLWQERVLAPKNSTTTSTSLARSRSCTRSRKIMVLKEYIINNE